MWQAFQVSIAGICGVMTTIFFLYCTVLLAGYITRKIEQRQGGGTDE